jgi:protein-tyrosine phosphatase
MTDFTNCVFRNISAPFQNEATKKTELIEETFKNSILNIPSFNELPVEKEFITIEQNIADKTVIEEENHSYVFTPLQKEFEINETEYYGPLPESNWVIKGQLIAGAYPGDENNDSTNINNLIKVLNCGVTQFSCLQKEYVEGISESTWRRGYGLRPYFEDVQKIIQNKSIYPTLDTNITDIKFTHLSIADCSITDDNETLAVAQKLVKDIQNGEVIYLHCWGGHGRTGIIVSLMLHLIYGITSVEAMRRCKFLHDMRKAKVNVGSPQTELQREQVSRIIEKLQNIEKC